MSKTTVAFGPERSAAWLLGILLLLGRWSPARVMHLDPHWAIDPRLWLTLALVAVAFTFGGGQRMRISWAFVLVATFQIMFLAYMIGSIAWAPSLEYAWPKALELGILLATLLAIARLAVAGDLTVLARELWLVIAGLSGLLALVGLATIAGGRLAVLGGGPNVLGRILGLLALFGAMRALTTSNPSRWLGVGAIACLLIVLTGSRGALLATGIAVAVFLLSARIRVGRLFVAALVAVTLTTIMLEFTELGQTAMEVFRERVVVLLFEERYTSGRDVIYDEAFRLAERHPAVGLGLGGFPAETGVVYPHNLYLEALVEGGMVGMILAFAATGVPCLVLARRLEPQVALAAAAMVLILVASQFSGDLYDARAVFIFGLLGVGTADARPLRLEDGSLA